tara:strand:- start:10540 stop:10713 length:174 start_codon:yes stop_codon:yes gene_type:complete
MIKKLIHRILGRNQGRAIYWRKGRKEFVGFLCNSGKILNVTEVTDTEELLKDLKIIR